MKQNETQLGVSRAEKTRALRYKRPALASIGYEIMTGELWEIQEACSDVAYYFPEGSDTLLDALDGDEEEAFEFQMAFSDLYAKVERLLYTLGEYDAAQDYDDCTVALIGNRYNLIGFDSAEEDYFALTGYDSELAESEAGKRLMRHTKSEMISLIGQSVGILMAFLDIRQQYDYLKATIDILRGENQAMLQAVRQIETLYDKAQEENSWERDASAFDAMAAILPERIWIE